MVELAHLEIWHSRPVAPTRRVALGEMDLPVSPAPGFGGLLLAAVVADSIVGLDADLHDDLLRLTRQLERGDRIPQPRLRHRFQVDRVGLSRSHHRLLGHGERIELDLHVGARPAQSLLGAVYAAGQLPSQARGPVMRMIRRAVRWSGAIDGSLIAHLTGSGVASGPWELPVGAVGDPVRWAMGVLGWPGRSAGGAPAKPEVQRRFRELLRAAHPDSGGHTRDAAERIAELSEARRILLAAS